MAYVGGDIIEININHPVLGARTAFPKSGENNTLNPGGFITQDDAGATTGAGKAIYTMNNERWELNAVIAWDMNQDLDLEFFRALAGHITEADYTVQMINGSVYTGKGKPVGSFAGSVNEATFPLKLQGSEKMKKQA